MMVENDHAEIRRFLAWAEVHFVRWAEKLGREREDILVAMSTALAGEWRAAALAELRRRSELDEGNVSHQPPIEISPRSPTAADIACDHILTRIQTDPDFAHFFWHTEGFRKLCEAQAAFTGQSLGEVEAQRKVTRFRGRERTYFNAREWEERK